ncbi:hypothetical protein ACROYT_G028207 [Oculina patagonica]
MRVVLLSANCLRRARLLLKLLHGRTMCSNSSDPAALHEALNKVSWLIGKWKGEGCGVYPTISPFSYGEELSFCHVGQPVLCYNSKTWHLEKGNPMHSEVGFLRAEAGTSKLAFMIAQNTGLTEVEEGEVNGHEIRLLSHSVGRMTFGPEPQVLKVERIFRLKDPNTLEMECLMETANTEHQKHLHVTYKKVTE